jgi:gliding motility-associated-like protein
MKKLLLLLLLTLLSVGNLRAQFDTEHWFAPMMDRNGSSGQQVLFLSTDRVIPFPVNIYSNNVVIGTVTISKGNPATFAVPRTNIITSTQSDLFTPVSKGLYMQGDYNYYVTLRFSITSHAEILTSKGKAGIGTTFYSVTAPITTNSSLYNFMTGIMATADNTTVTVSDYGSSVVFSNGTNGATTPTMTFTLNKGQSYIIEGRADNTTNLDANATSFIGAKIVSDKPITVTNGNFNGQFSASPFSGSDIIMDQSVPVERLGKEFVLIKGNGDIFTTSGAERKMEEGLIVAVEDATQIFVNDEITALATINEGEFFRIPGTKYINQGSSGHYNMRITTTKNVYVYQLLAGVATSNATLGFNYIPPVSCYLPRKIDEIGLINQMPGITPTVKLNILTEAGAAVTVNGVAPTAAQGPYPVTGSTTWVSYSIPNIAGNVTVNSDKAVTAGIAAGSSVYGYGGYFAGFSSVPAIVKQTGECIPGIILAVDDIYTTYQWFLNGVPIPGANSYQYTPTVPGVYTVTVSIPGCSPVTTPPYSVFSCPTETTQNMDVCGGMLFTVAFSNSTQPLDPTSITITSPPANGTVTVDQVNGTITYTPNVGYLGPDPFTYEFQSTVPTFFDSEIVTVNLNVVLLETNDDTITACPYNGVATYDLSTANVTTYAGSTYNYYPTLTDAENETNEIMNPTSYVSATGSVFVLVTTPEGCTDISKITLEFYTQPTVNDAILESCFVAATPTLGVFDLTTANVGSGTQKDYFPTLADAENNTNEIQNPFVYISGSGTLYVRVYNSNGCYNIAKITLTVIPPKYSTFLQDKVICIEDRTTLDAGPGFEAYEWSTGATTQSISNVSVGEYWVILTTDGCETLQTVKVTKAPEVVITHIEINNSTVTLTVNGGQPPYQYSMDGATWQDSNIFTELPRGQNTFYVKDSFDCNPISTEITVPNLINAITPNGDGINDYVDYSALRYKKDLTFSIYNRYGNRMHVGDTNNDYRWDGRYSEKKVLTGTYWYHISWTEPDGSNTPVLYKGWILVKNRE